MKTILPWSAATLVLAAIVHILAVLAAPQALMQAAMWRVERESGPNVPVQLPRADDPAQPISKLSPDFLYTACAFDLSGGTIRVSAPVPRDTYWSLSMFASNTDNFFVVNDMQIDKEEAEFLLVPHNSPVRYPNDLPIVVAPSPNGIILVRTLIREGNGVPALTQQQPVLGCEPA